MLGLIGRKTRKALAEAGDFLALLSVLFRARFYAAHRSRRRIFYKVSSRQVYLTAVMALPVNAFIALLLGFALVFNLPANTGGEQLVPLFSELFVIVIMRELAPVMCAILIVVRSGTAVTAKLGYLAIFREFDVLNNMGINPTNLFLVPVFFAFPVSMLLMIVYFLAVSLISADLTLWFLNPGIDPWEVASEVLHRAEANDLAIIVMKCLVSGLLIGLYAIRFGASMQGHVAKVTRSISTSGTRQLVSVLVANVAISLLAYAP